MPTSIDNDIAALKEQLKKPGLLFAVRRAIENEIKRLQRQATGKGKDRVAKTADGVEVKVGAIVYGFSLPMTDYVARGLRSKRDRNPSIEGYKLVAINRIGKVSFFEGYGRIFKIMTDRYSSPQAAHKAMIAAQAREVKYAKDGLATSRENLKVQRARLTVVKAFKLPRKILPAT